MIDDSFVFKDFDESTYLRLNPDVSAAVKNQTFKSAIDHCVLHGISEDRPGVPHALKEHMNYHTDELPSPPVKLRSRVHGDDSLQEFMKIGKLASYNIYSSFISLFENRCGNQILDFGCGCGRVISHLSTLLVNNQFYGSDIDSEAITWCTNNLSNIGKFSTNKALPPLIFDDEFFDAVYSISVFTHLPEDMQFMWLEELKRVIKKGGYLLTTTHGMELASNTIPDQINKRGFYYYVGNGTDGLPDFYQTSYHTEQYIRDHWSNYFEIVKIIKRGIAIHQDLIICRRIA